MDREHLKALDRFDTVWQRVLSAGGGASLTKPPAVTPDGTAGEFEEILQELLRLWDAYTAFARRTKGEAKKRFLLLAEETRNSVRTLQTEYFLRMGDIFHPAAAVHSETGILTGMHYAYQGEQRLIRRLTAEAGEAVPEEIRAVLEETAADHARALRDMIGQLLRK